MEKIKVKVYNIKKQTKLSEKVIEVTGTFDFNGIIKKNHTAKLTKTDYDSVAEKGYYLS